MTRRLFRTGRWNLLPFVILILSGFSGESHASHCRIEYGHRGVSEVGPSIRARETDPYKEEYKKLKRELDALLKELRRLEENVKDKFRHDIIPLLRKEIERLRKKLKEFQFKGGQPEDDETIQT